MTEGEKNRYCGFREGLQLPFDNCGLVGRWTHSPLSLSPLHLSLTKSLLLLSFPNLLLFIEFLNPILPSSLFAAGGRGRRGRPGWDHERGGSPSWPSCCWPPLPSGRRSQQQQPPQPAAPAAAARPNTPFSSIASASQVPHLLPLFISEVGSV